MSDVVERVRVGCRQPLARFPELLGEGVVAGRLEGAASAQRAGRCDCVCETAQMSVCAQIGPLEEFLSVFIT